MVIIDDHQSARDMLRSALERSGNGQRYTIVGEAGTGQEGIEICLRTRPKLLVLDMVLPGGCNGVQVLEALRNRLRSLHVVFFSGCQQEALISQGITLGAAAYVSKVQPLQTLLQALEVVEGGGKYFDPEIAHLVSRRAATEGAPTLTNREREVARLIAEGKSTKEAASLLGVSAKTLDKHRSRMMKKLGLHDAVAVTRYAIQAGLVSLP